MSFQDVIDQLKNDRTPNFLLMVSNKKRDRHTVANYTRIMRAMLSEEYRLITLYLPTVVVNKNFLASVEKIYEMDAIPFYVHHMNVFFLTDTGNYNLTLYVLCIFVFITYGNL